MPKLPKPPRTPPPATRRRRRRRKLGFALLVTTCALPLLTAAVARGDAAPSQTQGYVRIVNQVFGHMHWLRLSDPAEDETGAPNLVDLSPRARANPMVLEFVASSPLKADIAANDETRWLIDGDRVVGIDPRAHPLPRPFGGTAWHEDILYGNASKTAALSDEDGREIILVSPSSQGTDVAELVEVPISRASAAPGSVATPPDPIRATNVVFFDGSDRTPIARAQLVGQSVVVSPLADRVADVVVDERRGTRRATPTTRQQLRRMVMADQGSIRFMRDGAWVGARFRLTSTRPALSTYRYFGPRLTDDAFGVLGDEIENGIVAAGPRANRPVRTTLDRDLQLEVQRRLVTAVDALQDRSQRRFRAAVTVMDTINGDVLAVASATSRPTHGGGAATIDHEARNNNFMAMPIGSVAKVPLAAAIASQYPELRFLRITGGEQNFQQVLGLRLNDEHRELATRTNPMDFESFIEHSSNRYATALMLMGLATSPWQRSNCASEPYWLPEQGQTDAQLRSFSPRFQLSDAANLCANNSLPTGSLSSLVQQGGRRQNWFGLFGEIFSVEGLNEMPSDLRFNTAIWSGVGFGTLKDDKERVERALAPISPELESFGLGSASKLWEDYVNIILGGNRSRWTTIKVAEVYSRIVTGKRVMASLVLEQGSEPSAQQISALQAPRGNGASPWPLDGEVRLSILNGMRRAVASGSAARLADVPARITAPDGEVIRLFAKTGTPQLATSILIPERVVLNRLAGEDVIGLDSRHEPVVKRLQPGENERQALARLSEHRRGGYSADALASALEALRRELRANPRPLRGPYGLQLPVMRNFTETASASRPLGGAIAFVLARYCSDDAYFARPIAAVTVVINIEQRSNPRLNPATALAASLLDARSPIAPLLFRNTRTQGPQCRR